MPTIVAHLQKHFKLALYEGQPKAYVEPTESSGNLLKCCPLCGCSHQVTDVDYKKPYTPLCQTYPDMFKTQRSAWVKLYPEVTPFKTLHLVLAKA